VVLWSSGFIATRTAVQDAAPLTVLAIRFVIATLLILALAAWFRPVWPRDPRTLGHLAVAGVLNHAFYLGFSFEANAGGMPVSIIALIGSLQPVLTAVGAAWLLRERVGAWQWLGLVLGFAGVVLVLFDPVAVVPAPGLVALVIGSLLAMTLGTLYQKRYCGDVDLLSGTAVQFVVAVVVLGIAAASFEPLTVNWSTNFVSALLWLAVVNSTIGVNLLYWLIRRGAASRVTSLFYLVPPVTSVIAYFTIGERFGQNFLFGSAVAIAGVLLALHAPRPKVRANRA
jgi:drug/metabolite transporter (DMT)-like permease